VVALLIVYVVWGSTYLGIKVMIETMPPLLAAGVRYGIAGAIMLAALAVRARLLPTDNPAEKATGAHWRSAFIVGGLLLLGGNGGVVLSELYIPTGITAVLVATVPIWMAVFDSVLTRRRPSGLVIGGLFAGIAGVAVLVVPVAGLKGLDPLGVGLVLGAAICWAAGSIYARRAPLPRSGLLGTGMEMVAGGAALIVGGILLGEIGRTDIGAFSTGSIVAVVYLILFGSIVGFTAYTWLLAHVPVATVATYAYVNPIVAVALGAIFLSEAITPRTLIAAMIIIGAVIAMVSGRPRSVEEPGPVPEAATLEPPDEAGSDPAAGTRHEHDGPLRTD